MTTHQTPRPGSMRRAATTLAVMIALTASLLVTAATPAHAVGSYANSTIADVALRYLNQWGGNACRDAGKYQSGQCKQFVNCVVFIASGGTQYPAGGYSSGFAAAGGQEITASQAVRGDIIQVGESDTDYPLHTAIVLENKGGGIFYVVDSNTKYVTTNNEWVTQHNYTPPTNARYWRMGSVDRDGDGLGDAADACPDRLSSAVIAQGCQLAFPGGPFGPDFNSDGRADRVAFYRYDGQQVALFGWANTGAGFNAPTWVWQTPSGWDGNLVVPAGVSDYNGDGRLDVLAFYKYGGGQLALFGWANNGAGFNAPTWVWQTPSGWDGNLVVPAGVTDYNGDGRLDVLAFYKYGGGQLALFGWVNNGAGFNAPTWVWSTPTGWDGNRIIPAGVADFNSDGRLDALAFYRYDDGRLALFGWANNGAGFTGQTVLWNTPTGWDGNRIIPAGVADFNSDGRLDALAFYRYDDGHLALFGWANNGAGFTGQTVLWNTPTGWDGNRIIPAGVADFNSDGRLDALAFYRYDDGHLALFGWANNGAGFTGQTVLWNTPTGWDGNRIINVASGGYIKAPFAPAAATSVDGCGVANDSYTVPVSTGVEYLVGGAVKAAGTYPTGGAASVTVTARAKTGYVLTGTTTWTLSWTTTACTTTVTGAALSTPTWTLPKATLTWAATGAPAGTTVTYDVQYRAVTLSSTGARGYTTPTTWLTATTTTTGTLTGTASAVYQIHARTTDQYGTIGAWSPWTTVTMPTDDRATSFGYTGTWTTGTSASYYAGTYKLTSTAGAKVTVTAWTDQVSVIGARSTTSGKATITIDGVLKATIDTYGATAAYRQTLATITIPYGKHTITVTNLATTGRPRLILDALAFRR